MKTAGILLCLLLLYSCSDQTKPLCDPEQISTTFQEDRMIEIGLSTQFQFAFTIQEGEQTVFVYERTAAQCDDVNDDEYGEVLAFAVPLEHETSAFEYKDEELINLRCHYYEFGAWVNSSKQYAIRKGLIKGQKSGENEWYIQCSVLTDAIPEEGVPHAVEVNASFELK